ncbi:MAG TPA: DUF1501 domain-containing protein [Pirellulaceae bacterium]|nr:DUF1501 domain-containing protein [Pirellulaceae bacterium]
MFGTRRLFLSSASALASTGLISLAPAAPRFLVESALLGAERRGENILVVVQLSGGNDGLNTVVPYADEQYRRARHSLAINKQAVLKIDDQCGFHPSLKGFARLWEARELAIVQGVGYPNPNRSHFEAMDIWNSGHSEVAQQRSGWLGRALDLHKTESTSDTIALHLGDEPQPLALTARGVATPSVHSLERFKLDTSGDEMRRSAIQTSTQLPRTNQNELLKFVQTTSTAALAASQRIEAAAKNYQTSVKYPTSALAGKLKNVAQLIEAGLSTRIYYVAIDGWDTHSNQAAAHASLLEQLGDAVAAFTADLTQHGHGQRVVTLMFSEFGRRVQENASRGTDHGAAAPLFVAGAKVQAGLIGKQPSLTDLDDGDVKHHTDFRSVYAGLLEHWLKWPAAPVLGEKFAPLAVTEA